MKATSHKPQATSQGGYSLIELMVAIGLFAVVMTIMTSMFMLALRGQRKAITAQNVADNTRYAMEIMSKEIRMGSAFLSAGGSSSSLRFKSNMPNRLDSSSNPAIVEFSLLNGQILFDDDTGDDAISPDLTPPTSITSSNITVTALNFYLYTALASPLNTQKRALITIQAKSAGADADTGSSINLETVVAPRILQ